MSLGTRVRYVEIEKKIQHEEDGHEETGRRRGRRTPREQ